LNQNELLNQNILKFKILVSLRFENQVLKEPNYTQYR